MATTNRDPRQIALFIGNNEYQKAALSCCVNDAHDLSNKFCSMGFTVTVNTDCNYRRMRETIDDFTDQISPDDLVVFFFAGHGLQWNDQNYLMPIDANEITVKEDLKERAINAQSTLESMSKKKPYAVVFLFDCCREYCTENEALLTSRTRGGAPPRSGLGTMKASAGSLVAFPCAPGCTTEDVSQNHRNGLFTFHLLQHIAQPNTSIENILCHVFDGVEKETKGAQTPYRVSSFRYPNISFNIVDKNFGKYILSLVGRYYVSCSFVLYLTLEAVPTNELNYVRDTPYMQKKKSKINLGNSSLYNYFIIECTAYFR
jgi:uncharacterized caspase-like protein